MTQIKYYIKHLNVTVLTIVEVLNLLTPGAPFTRSYRLGVRRIINGDNLFQIRDSLLKFYAKKVRVLQSYFL
jgi:hypothetical protein